MKLAMTVWQDRVSPLFDVCGKLWLCTIRGEQVVDSYMRDLELEPGQTMEAVLRERIDVLVCGAISAQLQRALNGHGIEVLAFVMGDREKVLAAFLAGELPNPAMSLPGCGRHRRVRRRGGV
ncbi:MAG: NifB/NifX family molybdenum-iron cluster-binding protein [Myxococcota bacterium]|jgi:predicted Fe-Mo cluster-binding NifX family protein|nr:NifB/NifX family molybdenum-iron cluster-binding protein [Myxococcota bacterium]